MFRKMPKCVILPEAKTSQLHQEWYAEHLASFSSIKLLGFVQLDSNCIWPSASWSVSYCIFQYYFQLVHLVSLVRA